MKSSNMAGLWLATAALLLLGVQTLLGTALIRPSESPGSLKRVHLAVGLVIIVLASVHGSAAGAGLSLAFVADLCIATDDARFTPAYAKLGVSPDGGGTVGVVAAAGIRRAMQIYLAEDSFTAQQAHDWGLVAKVVPATELKAATERLALRLAQNDPASLAATKALIHRSPVTPIDQQLDAERDAIIACMRTEEFGVAVKKFTSKGK